MSPRKPAIKVPDHAITRFIAEYGMEVFLSALVNTVHTAIEYHSERVPGKLSNNPMLTHGLQTDQEKALVRFITSHDGITL